MQKTRWDIDVVLTYNLFDDSEAKGETTEASQGVMSFHCHSMVTGGLKRRKF